ncbi:phosphotriesterase family protein [Microbacterium sp. CPCC 204701]|uniref:phosphotriesterase family protein n=1 Tax=Microbacterium sp. CPCC 204701 TaxID=2493084 RepID=UPI000FD9422F|nr:phosphotriesterase [Microbacterium sp. CPCC 204701]
MTQIATVRGPIDAARLGNTLVHEHLFVMNTEYTENYRPDFEEAAMEHTAVEQLTALKAAGIDSIMDLTVLGLGRHIPRIIKVAEQVEINILASTGIYSYDSVPFPFMHVGPGRLVDRPDPLADHFIRDITEGIAGTSVKAACLKCAIDKPGLTEGVERIMRAIARAHLVTGAPISVHTDVGSRNGLIAQRVLAEEGVDLRDVIVGHSGDTQDLDHLMEIADQGSILGMDRFGMHTTMTHDQRVDIVVRLIERGYVDRIGLSHDNFCYADHFPAGEPHNGVFKGLRYTYISEEVLPSLRERGITEGQIHQMLVENPRRHFEDSYRRAAGRDIGSATA